jgi:hypothetical protein
MSDKEEQDRDPELAQDDLDSVAGGCMIRIPIFDPEPGLEPIICPVEPVSPLSPLG